MRISRFCTRADRLKYRRGVRQEHIFYEVPVCIHVMIFDPNKHRSEESDMKHEIKSDGNKALKTRQIKSGKHEIQIKAEVPAIHSTLM